MPEKRFKKIEVYLSYEIFDNDNNKQLDVDSVVDLLNEQHRQIQSQSIVIQGYQERCDKVFKENVQLKKENNELKLIIQQNKFAKEEGFK